MWLKLLYLQEKPENADFCSLAGQDEERCFSVRIVIPTLNEEKNLGPLLTKLNTLGYFDIVIIDGNSDDKTIEIAKRFGVRVIIQNGHGKGNAIKQVLNDDLVNVDAFIFMDADGSMDPKEIPKFVTALKSGADFVKGSRFLKGGCSYDISTLRIIGNTLFMTLVNLLHSAKYTDLCYGYFAFNKRSINLITPFLESQNFEIETEIAMRAKKLGLNITEVSSIEVERKNGKSNLKTFNDGFKILRTIIKSCFY